MVEARLEGLEKIIKITKGEIYIQAAVRAANKSIIHTRKYWMQKIREMLAIRQSYLRERVFEIRKATKTKNYAMIIVKEKKSYSLYHAYPIRQTSQGIVGQIYKKKSFLIPHGFIVQGRGAFRRKKIGDRFVPRYPLTFLRGPTIALFSRKRDLQKEIENEAITYMQKVLRSNIIGLLRSKT